MQSGDRVSFVFPFFVEFEFYRKFNDVHPMEYYLYKYGNYCFVRTILHSKEDFNFGFEISWVVGKELFYEDILEVNKTSIENSSFAEVAEDIYNILGLTDSSRMKTKVLTIGNITGEPRYFRFNIEDLRNPKDDRIYHIGEEDNVFDSKEHLRKTMELLMFLSENKKYVVEEDGSYVHVLGKYPEQH